MRPKICALLFVNIDFIYLSIDYVMINNFDFVSATFIRVQTSSWWNSLPGLSPGWWLYRLRSDMDVSQAWPDEACSRAGTGVLSSTGFIPTLSIHQVSKTFLHIFNLPNIQYYFLLTPIIYFLVGKLIIVKLFFWLTCNYG